MYQGKTISVIFPAYNEEKNIKNAIDDFFSIKVVDEIIVVDNNSKDNTVKEGVSTLISEKPLERLQRQAWAHLCLLMKTLMSSFNPSNQGHCWRTRTFISPGTS